MYFRYDALETTLFCLIAGQPPLYTCSTSVLSSISAIISINYIMDLVSILLWISINSYGDGPVINEYSEWGTKTITMTRGN